MKNLTTILLVTISMLSLSSCNKEKEEEIDFYDNEYRIGLWINSVGSNRKDTLQFVNDSILIRKGDFYVYERYLYRIEGKTLFVRLPDSSLETQHAISTIDKNGVILGNMYITSGFTTNSGTFYKDIKN